VQINHTTSTDAADLDNEREQDGSCSNDAEEQLHSADDVEREHDGSCSDEAAEHLDGADDDEREHYSQNDDVENDEHMETVNILILH